MRALTSSGKSSTHAYGSRFIRCAGREPNGEPVIFDASVFDALRAADPRVGAKAVFASHRARILDVPVTDEGAFLDLDTPQDYERINRS